MSFFKGILFGAGLGTLGGLLLAPRKGEETREKLITNTRELRGVLRMNQPAFQES